MIRCPACGGTGSVDYLRCPVCTGLGRWTRWPWVWRSRVRRYLWWVYAEQLQEEHAADLALLAEAGGAMRKCASWF